VGLEDSNMANYGSKEHIDARKKAAQSEKEFVGAGTKVGLEIWRVENRRTAADTPDFGVKRWPKEDYGSFFSGDSYLILNTYKEKPKPGEPVKDKLLWDVHFWLGKESSQDEIGVAAYKAVELDDLLDDGPVQHREVQGDESDLFASYFPKGITLMSGGIASGFRKVKPDEYVPRLFQVRRTRKTVRAFEVPCMAKSMNVGDVFILDAGVKIYTYIGEYSNAFEKMKGGAMASSIAAGRMGKSKMMMDLDDDFWSTLKGSAKDVQPADERDDEPEEPQMNPDNVNLFRLSDASGKLTFKKEKENTKVTLKDFDSNDVFIVDANIEIFVWVGKGASQSEKSQCMKYAMSYLADQKKPATTPITRIIDGQVHHVFGSIVAPAGTPALGVASRPKSVQMVAPKATAAPAFASATLKSTPTPAAAPAAASSAAAPKYASVALKSSGGPPAAAAAATGSAAPKYSVGGLKPTPGKEEKKEDAPAGGQAGSRMSVGLKSSGGPKLW